MPLSYRNQSIDLRNKSIDWFLYDNGLRLERVKGYTVEVYLLHQIYLMLKAKFGGVAFINKFFCQRIQLIVSSFVDYKRILAVTGMITILFGRSCVV